MNCLDHEKRCKLTTGQVPCSHRVLLSGAIPIQSPCPPVRCHSHPVTVSFSCFSVFVWKCVQAALEFTQQWTLRRTSHFYMFIICLPMKGLAYTWTNIFACIWTQRMTLLNILATCLRVWLQQPQRNGNAYSYVLYIYIYIFKLPNIPCYLCILIHVFNWLFMDTFCHNTHFVFIVLSFFRPFSYCCRLIYS